MTKNKRLSQELLLLNFDALNASAKREFIQRIAKGKLVMEEDPFSHICVYTLPYHHKTKKVLIGHHIKANKWIVPGGHIDAGETIKETAVREIAEELGCRVTTPALSEPFHVSISTITSKPPRQCIKHFDLWVHFTSTDDTMLLDESEFYTSKWVSLTEAIAMTTDQANKDALEKFQVLEKASKIQSSKAV